MDVTGMEKIPVSHHNINHTQPARQVIPWGAIPSIGGRSLINMHAMGPDRKQRICLTRGEIRTVMTSTPGPWIWRCWWNRYRAAAAVELKSTKEYEIRLFIFSYNGQYVIFLFFSVRLTTFNEIFYEYRKIGSVSSCLRWSPLNSSDRRPSLFKGQAHTHRPPIALLYFG